MWHDFIRRCHLSRRHSYLFAAVLAVPVALFGQSPAAAPANPITASEKGLYGIYARVARLSGWVQQNAK
jgi:hypothetical protein